ncbi:MAG: hypothetical protein R3C56_05350 [Pirellulaceae bacterium]
MRVANSLAMFQMAIRGVMMHKLRSLLTVLGLVFGVASVIRHVGSSRRGQPTSPTPDRRLGINNVIVRSVKPTASDQEINYRSFVQSYGLTYDDLRRTKRP